MQYTEERAALLQQAPAAVTETLRTPVITEADVLVAGGGVAGLTAALAAARLGARVLLLERTGCLGGYATLGLVNYVTPYRDWQERVVGGIAAEVIEELKHQGALEDEYDVSEEHPWLAEDRDWKTRLFGDTSGMRRTGVQFDAQKLKLLADRLLDEAGCRVLYHAMVVAAQSEDGRVTTVIAETRSGRVAVSAKVFVDCTGDGDLAAHAGARFQKGRDSDGLTLPVTTMVVLRGVDARAAMEYQHRSRESYGYADLIRQAKAAGELDIPHSYMLVRPTITGDGLEINGTRVTGIDGTHYQHVTRAEQEVRRQAAQLERFFRQYVPGCQNAYLGDIAPMLGVRESRRILGEYVVGDDDLPSGAKFPDVVGRGTIHVDIHNPDGAGYDIRPVRSGDWYDIPYRCLVVKDLRNLLVAGRCISASSVAQSGLRLYLNVFVTGQAAGTAAALCARQSTDCAALDISTLQRTLEQAGVKLKPAPSPAR